MLNIFPEKFIITEDCVMFITQKMALQSGSQLYKCMQAM